MYRYPFTPYPSSWFRVAFSEEVRAGRTHAVQFLGRKMLLVREGGEVRALGATCPHLGADLSRSPIIDGQLECPFHGWRFDLNGGCAQMVARIRSKWVELVALLTPTPIDDQYLDVGLWIFFKKTRNPLLDWVTSIVVPRDIRADFANDIPIWEQRTTSRILSSARATDRS